MVRVVSWYVYVQSIIDTARCSYNAVNFLQRPQNRHPIAHPWGRGMGVCYDSKVWFISAAVNTMSYVISWLDRVITAFDCNAMDDCNGNMSSHYSFATLQYNSRCFIVSQMGELVFQIHSRMTWISWSDTQHSGRKSIATWFGNGWVL